MLILSRTLGESILIGDDYQLKVLSIEGGKVRICILPRRSDITARVELVKSITGEKIKIADNPSDVY